MREWVVGIFLMTCASSVSVLADQEEFSKAEVRYVLENVVKVVPNGPPETYVYKSDGDRNSSDPRRNTFGKFVIGPGENGGTANYWWRGKGPTSNPDSQHYDSLEFKKNVLVRDQRGDTEPEVSGWLYEATDSSGNKWWLVFGEDRVRGRSYYPVYYSFSDPSENNFKRWLTFSGTSRL